VTLISNSTISNFHALASIEHLESRMIRFNVSSETGFGFIRIRIPHALMNETYNVTVDGAEPHYVNYTLYDNGTDRWIYFSYQHSTHEVTIASEFPSFLILSLFMTASLLAVITYRKKVPCVVRLQQGFYVKGYYVCAKKCYRKDD
jgi:hypothetical protein